MKEATIQTNMRLTQNERDFLKEVGNGDISAGFKECLISGGYRENALSIYCSEASEGDGWVFYRLVNDKPADFAFTNDFDVVNFREDECVGFRADDLKRIMAEYFDYFYNKETTITVTSNDFGFTWSNK